MCGWSRRDPSLAPADTLPGSPAFSWTAKHGNVRFHGKNVIIYITFVRTQYSILISNGGIPGKKFL